MARRKTIITRTMKSTTATCFPAFRYIQVGRGTAFRITGNLQHGSAKDCSCRRRGCQHKALRHDGGRIFGPCRYSSRPKGSGRKSRVTGKETFSNRTIVQSTLKKEREDNHGRKRL